ncbi:hypothetical protein FDENT_5194 [Fusarium denticulatum]|uniref:Uncharacterized protein n=1 Tax=Fusarium denticulatum TaxID=48507 RepID=A0A8H5XAZ1_9HYPO|nr:hypothetical protein FDENT_5194 [Fusarium denticulatum]
MEQLRRRRSGEPLFVPVAKAVRKPPKRPKVIRRPRPDDYSEDDEDEFILKRISGTPSTTDITSLRLPATNGSTCAGCGSSSHRLNICMKASQSDGLMKGCPRCNTLDHSLTDCPDTKHDLAMQLECIQMRANMPFFQPTQEWVDVVRAAVADGHKPLNNFPWTVKFTKKMYNAIEALHQDLDKVGINRRVGLPIDPSTKDWETIQRNFSLGDLALGGARRLQLIEQWT